MNGVQQRHGMRRSSLHFVLRMSCAVCSRYTFSAWQFSLVWRHGRVETVGPRVRIIFSLCPEVETTLITFIYDL